MLLIENTTVSRFVLNLVVTACLSLVLGGTPAWGQPFRHGNWTNFGSSNITSASVDFDYFVLALSWSPTFCVTAEGRRREKLAQCERPLGFVVHGLWPQFNRGYPQDCGPSAHVPVELASLVLNAKAPMPPGDPRLIDHEWSKHGTCSGLDMAGYFTAIKSLVDRLSIPDELKAPERLIEEDFGTIARLFERANPGLTAEMMEVSSDRRGNISELHVCFDRQLAFHSCGNRRRADGGRFLPVR